MIRDKIYRFKLQFPANLWIKVILLSLIFIIISFVIYTLNILLIPITLGFLFAFLVSPLIMKLESKNMHRALAIAVVFSLMGVLVLGTLGVSAPLLVSEVKEFKANESNYKELVITKYNALKEKVEKAIPDTISWDKIENNVIGMMSKISAKWISKLPKMIAGSFETIFMFIIIIPLVAFFTLKDGPMLKKWIIHLVPNRYFELTTEILYNINRQTGAFIRGQIMDCGINAVVISTLLAIIGLPYYLIVGVFAGIANAIPFIGPLVAGSIGVTVAVLGDTSPWAVIMVFVFAHLIDVMFIYPKTVGHSLNLHELVVIFGIVLGGHLGGIIGMLFIIPLLGILLRSTKIMYKLLKGYNII